MGRMSKDDRNLLKVFFKLPGGKRRAGRELSRRAATFMNVTEKEFARGFIEGGENERAALRAIASEDDAWMSHFTPTGEGRDWEGFFAALSECLANFLPLILAV